MRSGRGQSDLIGTVLMISVVVVTVTTVGAFAIDRQADSIRNTPPQTQFEATPQDITVSLTHKWGETVRFDELSFQIRGFDGTTEFDLADDATLVATERDADDEFEPGESVVFRHDYTGQLRFLLAETGDGGSILYDDKQTPGRIVVDRMYPSPDTSAGEEECVVFENRGGSEVDLTGWTIEDEGANHQYTFPDGFVLEPGDSVKLHEESGQDNETDLFWDEQFVWNNNGDTVYIYNKYDHEVRTFSYGSGYDGPGTCADDEGEIVYNNDAVAEDSDGDGENTKAAVQFSITNTGEIPRTIEDVYVNTTDAAYLAEFSGDAPYEHEIILEMADSWYANEKWYDPYRYETGTSVDDYEDEKQLSNDIAGGETATIYLYRFENEVGDQLDMEGATIEVEFVFGNGESVTFTLTP